MGVFWLSFKALEPGTNGLQGEVAEWSNAAVLKTVDPNGSGGSNPSLSARLGKQAVMGKYIKFIYLLEILMIQFEARKQ